MSGTMNGTRGKILWFELPAGDTDRAQEFYAHLFGWHVQRVGELDYHTSDEAGGAIYHAPGDEGPNVYFGTDEIDRAIARVRELGGLAGERQEIPNVGSYAHCQDTEGNRFGLYQASDGD